MGWQDRDYNAGREEMRAYLANPGALLQYALPIYKSRKLYIHLSFWFILAAIFLAINDLRNGVPGAVPLDLVAMLALCLFHELGHRVFARFVGGNHWEWVLWPLGGMVAPTCPRTPRATFIANVGGIVFTAISLAALSLAVLAFGGHLSILALFHIPYAMIPLIPTVPMSVSLMLMNASLLCSGIILINLFPCFWFDGGHLWQSVLWPKFGPWKSIRITCMAGMILAVPFLLVAFYMKSPFMIIFWALVFADCFRRRMALAHAGPDVIEDDGSAYDYMDTQTAPKRKKLKKRWLTSARKRAVKDQAEQAKIDAILAKVKEKGLHSLTWWEKRSLRKATERQRQHDLAERR